MRTASAAVAQGASTGALSRAWREEATAAIAVADGRTAAAIDAFRGFIAVFDQLGQPFDAAEMAVDAAILMPGDPTIRRMAEEHRPILELVGARPILLARLDAALASMPLASPASAAIHAEAPTAGT